MKLSGITQSGDGLAFGELGCQSLVPQTGHRFRDVVGELVEDIGLGSRVQPQARGDAVQVGPAVGPWVRHR